MESLEIILIYASKMNKRGELEWTTIVVSILALIALGAGIYFVSIYISQGAFASETAEHATIDCDEDGSFWPEDICFCDPNIVEGNCGPNSKKSKELCPLSCKK